LGKKITTTYDDGTKRIEQDDLDIPAMPGPN